MHDKLPACGAFVIGEKGRVFSPDDSGTRFLVAMKGNDGIVPGEQHEGCKAIPPSYRFPNADYKDHFMPAPDRYHIRLYRPEDLTRLQQITADIFGPASIDLCIEKVFGCFGGGDWRSRKLGAIAEDCRLQPDGVFVAEDPSGVVAGYVTTRLNPGSGIGWIPNLAVAAAHQERGLGRRLLERAIAFFKERGMAVAKIETLEHNHGGQSLYPNLGFKEVARQIHYAMRLDD